MHWYAAPGIQGSQEKGKRVKQVAGLATYNGNARGSVCRYLGQDPPPRPCRYCATGGSSRSSSLAASLSWIILLWLKYSVRQVVTTKGDARCALAYARYLQILPRKPRSSNKVSVYQATSVNLSSIKVRSVRIKSLRAWICQSRWAESTARVDVSSNCIL